VVHQKQHTSDAQGHTNNAQGHANDNKDAFFTVGVVCKNQTRSIFVGVLPTFHDTPPVLASGAGGANAARRVYIGNESALVDHRL